MREADMKCKVAVYLLPSSLDNAPVEALCLLHSVCKSQHSAALPHFDTVGEPFSPRILRRDLLREEKTVK